MVEAEVIFVNLSFYRKLADLPKITKRKREFLTSYTQLMTEWDSTKVIF